MLIYIERKDKFCFKGLPNILAQNSRWDVVFAQGPGSPRLKTTVTEVKRYSKKR